MNLKDIRQYLSNIFETKRKNAVSLPNDTALSSDLKKVKIGQEDTPIEISTTEVRVKGTINADAINVDGSAVQTGTEAGATELNELSDVSYSSGDLTITDLDKIVADDFVVDSGASIALDSHNGNFIAKTTGTEFSVANSSYAGMIVGYRMIGEGAVHDSYTLTTSMAVPDSAMTVRFVAPPSGAVEIMVQYFQDTASGRSITVGLSDNATYNSLGNSYEQVTGMVDETDNYVHQHYWAISGLTKNTTYNYWFGIKSSGGIGNTISWGGTATGRYCDFIMKVTALPTEVSDFAVYD